MSEEIKEPGLKAEMIFNATLSIIALAVLVAQIYQIETQTKIGIERACKRFPEYKYIEDFLYKMRAKSPAYKFHPVEFTVNVGSQDVTCKVR